METREIVREIASQARELKKHMWLDHGERDLPPLVAYLMEGQEEYSQAPPELIILEANRAGSIPGGLYNFFTGAKPVWEEADYEFPGWRHIFVITDGYVRQGDLDMEMPERGDLTRDFETNPATDVSEGLTVCVAADDLVGGCEIAMASMAYVVTDGGGITFSEMTVHVDGDEEGCLLEGAIPDVLRCVFEEGKS